MTTLKAETIKYTIKYMIDKMIASGMTKKQVNGYMVSEEAIVKIFELASKFEASIK